VKLVFDVDLILAGALLVALFVILYRFIAFCLDDLAHATVVRYLPRETWRLLIMIWIPFGGLLSLRYGRVP
jgi:hypothetical protein